MSLRVREEVQILLRPHRLTSSFCPCQCRCSFAVFNDTASLALLALNKNNAVAQISMVKKKSKKVEFVPTAEAIATAVMQEKGHEAYAERFSTIIRFLVANPKKTSALQKRSIERGSLEYIHGAADQFIKSRESRTPVPPKTVPDEMVSFILNKWFEVSEEDLQRFKEEHSLSMAAENIIGELLERYLAIQLEEKGWVWASGSLVKDIDFILPYVARGKEKWHQLQVKNRSNSENAAGKSVRKNTTILKWHRTNAYNAGSRWNLFPKLSTEVAFSEEEFRNFVQEYLLTLKGGKA